MSQATTTLLDYAAFKQPPTPLFRDYLAGAERVRPFFDGGRWDEAALLAHGSAVAAHPRRLAELATALVRQQKARGSEDAAANAAKLTEPGALVIATGQQAGLFGGPLYVAYKAAAALRIAATLSARRTQPVIAVFWVAADDHDFAEIRTTTVLDESGQLRNVRYAPRVEPTGVPASRIVFDETVAATLAELRDALPAGLLRDEWLDELSRCYAAGETFASAFSRFVSRLFPRLVVLDPSDPAIKALMAPVFRREIAEGSPTSRLARDVGESLRVAGYHQQVPVRDRFLNLFLYLDGARRALALQDGHVEVRGLGRKMTIDEAVALVDADPSAFSPGVLLRPLGQDWMLPTVAYVGGPSEIAYHAQIGPSYAHFGIPRPVVFPRPSLTLVEASAARTLEAEKLQVTDLQGDLDALFGVWARDTYPGVEGAFARVREGLARDMKSVEDTLGAVDPTLRAAADATLGRALHPINTLHEKATRALKKKDQTRAERVRRTRDMLFPGGALQERGLGLVGFVARHGRALLDELVERVDPWAAGHQVVFL